MEAICDRVIIINKGKLVADDKLSVLQQHDSGEQIVLVTFKEAIDKQLFAGFHHIRQVESLSATSFRITTGNPESIRKQILELALQHNLNIVSLHSDNQSLEDIFRSLTNNPQPTPPGDGAANH